MELIISDNLDEAIAELDALSQRIRFRVGARAVSAATKPVLDAMRSEAPVDTGHLRKSLGRRTDRDRGIGRIRGRVGVRDKFDVFYARFIEFGRILPDGTHHPGNPFMTRAVSRSRRTAQDQLTRTLDQEIRNAVESGQA